MSLAWWLWKKRPDLDSVNGIAACAGVLCAPLAWHVYILVIAPFFVARAWGRLATIAALLLFVPTWHLIAITGSPVYIVIVGIMAWTLATPSSQSAIQPLKAPQ